MYFRFNKFCCFIIITALIAGCERQSSSVNDNDELPPAVPAGVNIFYSQDGKIGIEWILNNEYDIKSYQVYRSENDSLHFRLIASAYQDYFVDDSLDYDTTYFYYITALDNDNNESEPSKFVSAKPANKNNPGKPAYPEINARNWLDSISIYLSWANNPESDISHYEIHRSEQQDFTPGSETLLGISLTNSYSDKYNLKLYTNYYYKIIAVDKGNLKSGASDEIYDSIFEIPRLLYPSDKSLVNYFNYFLIKAVAVPAKYKIVLQTNEYFGEIWTKEFESNIVNDTISIIFDADYIELYKDYYWRIITYSNNSLKPNSISGLYRFTLKE
ncbi:MAG: hypothetical protein C4539_15565 [Ignavibacteriales bacterium]|nr:MAG: hypothetical protein C4539_15565 [Ignavibacteriales bacterium]